MGNCLSTCTARSPGQNGGELVLSYSGGKIFHSSKETTPQNEKEPKEYNIVQKELEALQSQISHSQAVLASLKFTFLEATVLRTNNLDKVHRTTQTFQDLTLPKSLEDVPSQTRQREKPEHARSCPVIASIAVQTDGETRTCPISQDKEYFLPPIGSHLDPQRHKDQTSGNHQLQSGLDLDIYRSCRKLSVLPEEEPDESPPCRLAPSKYPDHQAYSFDSYLQPSASPMGPVRQMSDPTPSTRRPLQVNTQIGGGNVEDSGLGSELRVSSPSPTTPCWKTPPATPSSDTSLSWQTPTSSSQSPEPDKQMLSVLLDPPSSSTDPLARVPSRRRLVRSLARIGSEPPDFTFDPPTPGEVPFPVPNMIDSQDKRQDLIEANQTTFPNLTDDDLKQLGIWIHPTEEQKEQSVTDEDVENKYTSLVLAFKTDKMTLDRRVELQNKLRDQAEINLTHEVETLKSVIQVLNSLCTDVERNDLFEKIRQQVEALYKAALRVSSTAEMYGAVQQEKRLSKAVDIILKHVENLKHTYEKEKAEHEDTRKLLKENQGLSMNSVVDPGKRRASIATVHQQGHSDIPSSLGERRGSLSRRGSTLRRLSKNHSQNDIKHNGNEGDALNKIFEGCDTCGSRLRLDSDSIASNQNSSDGESHSEDESSCKKRSNSVKEEEEEARKMATLRLRLRKRTSFSTPIWVQKVTKYVHQMQPYEEFGMQARYCVAGLLVAAALAIVASSFFRSEDN